MASLENSSKNYDKLFRQYLSAMRTLEISFEDDEEMPKVWIDFPDDPSLSGMYLVADLCQDHVPNELFFVVFCSEPEFNAEGVLEVSLSQLNTAALEKIYDHLKKKYNRKKWNIFIKEYIAYW